MELESFLHDPMRICQEAVCAIGIIGGIVAAMFYSDIKVNFFEYFDLVMPSVALHRGLGELVLSCWLLLWTRDRFGHWRYVSQFIYCAQWSKAYPHSIVLKRGGFLNCYRVAIICAERPKNG